MKKNLHGFQRKRADLLTEELVTVLLQNGWCEFKPLFLLVFANLRARRSGTGCKEMLRLRLYDKLQGFVLQGVVEKRGKEYRGNPAPLVALRETFVAMATAAASKALPADVTAVTSEPPTDSGHALIA